MTLRLFDALRGQVVPFEPIGSGPVGMYVCGVTPYDTGHLGHAFTYVSFDVLHRYLEYLGYRVTYVQNLTDVDDDLLRRARELGEDYLALGNRHVTTFLAEMAELNWLPPDVYPRATRHIGQMQDMIGRLLERGHAYLAEGHVYFSVDSWERYGELSKLPREAMLPVANERGNVPDMPGKRDPLDFVLWQPSAPDEPSWPSPWGPGRPGWHIECSAMSTTYLGPRFEIHGGGADLAFPHHESEIAQSEAATGESPFVSWWMHAGMLRYTGEKMSKSLGNLVLVRDLLRSYSGDTIRHYLISHHYRDEVDFLEADLAASVDASARLHQACAAAQEADPFASTRADPATLDARVAEHRERFLAAMDDDLQTPMALRELNALADICLATDDAGLRAQSGWMVRELGARILGLRLATAPAVREADQERVPA
ncbi:MAG TPA: cysteine--tRNA ligase [candidate division Zixibacteria bacterium]|nr:cysteine--tRNA ligase [candidate division Zixibacteria bacterium]